VKVRVLLNDDAVFLRGPDADRKKKKNLETVQYLNSQARELKLPLEGRIINIKKLEITYVHNKGMIADRERVLISSINGTENSITNNRETGVVLESTDAGKYFSDVFDLDWELSATSEPLDSESNHSPVPDSQ
jgi:phosphatidylserine/phosphatidylglycerophosphate/cardiolipin synthase-like enzyme